LRRATASALLLLLALAAGCGGHEKTAQTTTAASRRQQSAPEPRHFALRRIGTLPAPLQDAAAAAVDRKRVLLLGGLDAADSSTATVRLFSGDRARGVGVLGGPLHDAAAVTLGTSVYLFGGGNGVAQLDAIQRVDPRTGTSAVVGRLPAPSSDHAAAAVDGTAYVVGGYTGRRWLDTIVAWRPGSAARVVARLPTPLRYAAVAAADGRLVIAGGSLPGGRASSAVFAYDPQTRKLSRVGRLPQPTTHAAAATLAGDVYVVGGRGAVVGTPTSHVVEVEPEGGLRIAGLLPRPLSDASAIGLDNRILVAGGRTGDSATDQLGELIGTRQRTRARKSTNVYAADAAGLLSAAVRHDPPRVFVPNSESNTVDVVDQRTFRVVRHFAVGVLPQHVVPSYDLKTLYVTNDESNSLTAIDPRNGRVLRTIRVADPYNMYFTPDGRYAIVVAERLRRLDFRDVHSFELHKSLSVGTCKGVDHIDFSADGSYLIASCEFSGRMIEVDVKRERVVGELVLPHAGAMPQDVKVSPDGRVFYVADMASNGVWELTGKPFRRIGFLATGKGAHGLYPSRDARLLYITNRGEGSISVLDFAKRKLVAKWWVGGSPDMGGVSADGTVLWVTGRWNARLYAISTRTGKLLASIPVGAGPHGACVWPQPGRYSLGHTGILR
jgi:YVTN family beta-propeller protein